MISQLTIKNRVKIEFDYILKNNNEFHTFYNEALNIGDLYMVGGAVRDLSLAKKPKDFDFIIDCNQDELNKLLKVYPFKINRFSGYKLDINGINMDVWTLDNHWAFKQDLYECTVENISKGAFFNYDAVTINLNNQWLDADSFIESYEKKLLDFNLNEQHVHLNPNPMKNVQRAFKLKETFGFELSERLLSYCEYHMNKSLPD